MKIHQLEIQNFKGFEKEVFNFNPHFTVLIGDNAKGKTTILDALAVATGSFLLGIEEVSSRSIKEDEIRTIFINKQAKPQKPVLVTANGVVNGENLEWTREVIISNTTQKKAINIRKVAAQILSDSRNKNKNFQTFFPILAYYGTSRLAKKQIRIDDQQDQEKEGFIRAYQDAFEAGVSDNLFLSWYKIQKDSIKETDTIIKKLADKSEKIDDNTMKDYLLSIALLNAFEQTIIQTANDISEISFESNTMFFYVRRKDSNVVEKLKYSQLSDGYRNIIGLAADIAYRCIQLNPHLGENAVKNTEGIVLIDEIDLHLHPKWQRRIVGDLKRIFPNIQFVATTHSPFIVQSLASDELINLEKIVDSPTDDFNVNEISTYLMGVDSPYSEKNNALYKKSKLFIEGIDKGLEKTELNEILNSIPNPALRAFLELTKMAKGK